MIFSFLKFIFSKLPESNRFERIWKIAQIDFKKRYYNDRIGLLWALLNPVLEVSVYYIVFTFLMNIERSGIENFALFIFSAIIFWKAFKETTKKGMKILSSKRYLIENIKVNKIDLFLSNGLATFFGFIFNLSAFILLSLLYGVHLSTTFFFLPILILNTFLIAVGLGMILSGAYILVRDIEHLLDIVFLVGFWVSGIFFPSERVLEVWAPLYYINPFLGIFHNVRAILVFNSNLDLIIMNFNLVVGIVIYGLGVYVVKNHTAKVLEKA